MRVLTEKEDKYKYNTWDKVEMPEEYKTEALRKIERDNLVSAKDYEITYEPWDSFYKRYNRTFFKERQWISKEYPELLVCTNKILELGCGTGSTLIPIIRERIDRRNSYLQSGAEISEESTEIQDKDAPEQIVLDSKDVSKCENIFGVDYSSTAVELLRERVPQIKNQFAPSDITQLTEVVIEGKEIVQVDIILLIYTLSAIHPSAYPSIFSLIHRTLSSQGIVIFKDYYEMDLTQLRFKKDQVLSKNFYQRGDKTYVYYFSREEIEKQTAGLFKIVKYTEDKKLILNRKKQKEMYRCFIEMKLEKI
ncbi:tRNAThr (cytosine32-N3)-methyltransferase [Nematocida ausubeli]|uniref:tRNA N(3)-methylcytidine methyltransferase n=1 Tax=Nematocida ausubeli (strain ATCC PRA-371 / ERTm2) TaxID=1913371 RepID=A0A086J3G2_NEMA1|nr:uncharacterized protein NESG_00831 [Nematocida ausubeli]KAI5151643.1 tRNAThr (cytosine32-N3)-methyltransferase [Nematocida ausubeli]KAI5160738.1 tRNAThr (cytosine32-N3)-methyltransferase [Nematocida ausubeli]KFG26680.1 hypothetical protein NESG_00831 [Nematocida ausubeli]